MLQAVVVLRFKITGCWPTPRSWWGPARPRSRRRGWTRSGWSPAWPPCPARATSAMPSGRHAHRSWNAYAERCEVVSRQSDGQDRGEALDLFTERPCL